MATLGGVLRESADRHQDSPVLFQFSLAAPLIGHITRHERGRFQSGGPLLRFPSLNGGRGAGGGVGVVRPDRDSEGEGESMEDGSWCVCPVPAAVEEGKGRLSGAFPAPAGSRLFRATGGCG